MQIRTRMCMGACDIRAGTRSRPVAVADLDVFILSSRRPSGTPDDVTVDSDPQRLLEKVRGAPGAS